MVIPVFFLIMTSLYMDYLRTWLFGFLVCIPVVLNHMALIWWWKCYPRLIGCFRSYEKVEHIHIWKCRLPRMGCWWRARGMWRSVDNSNGTRIWVQRIF